MKIALVTTTIRVPRVLVLYEQLASAAGVDYEAFVALDRNSSEDAANFCTYDVNRTHPIFIGDQNNYKCSELIGWNSDARRNIATLEALRWGADVLYFVDDDNIPLGNPFVDIQNGMGLRFSGVEARTGWFDQGQLLVPPAKQRGAPFEAAHPNFVIDSVVGQTVGVLAGTCLGDPDIDAATRITSTPTVHQASELLRSGVVVHPDCFSVFNSQNTAVVRELAPAMFIMPGSGTGNFLGRNCDIYASLIVRRVANDRGLRIHCGAPFVWQQRNPHNLLKDMRSEQLALERVDEFARMVDRFAKRSDPLLPWLGALFDVLDATTEWWSHEATLAMHAWIEDCKKVMQ